METTNVWNSFSIYRYQVVIGLFVAMWFIGHVAIAQKTIKVTKEHNPNYDDRKFSYGFEIGLHSVAYTVRYSDKYVSPNMDTLHSVVCPYGPGFFMGFLISMRLHDNWDIQLMPHVSFYEYKLQYRYTDRSTLSQIIENTQVEPSVRLKFKSMRRGNVRMYVVGGFTPSFQMGGKRTASNSSSVLDISKYNLSADTGVGFDFYFPLFKFSPELRFSTGLLNVLQSSDGEFADPINKLKTQKIAIFFTFN